MDQECYLRIFSRRVRWRLPRVEADDILSDYEEILRHYPEAHSDTLVQALGTPHQAARLLPASKEYRCWLVVFSVLMLCLLLPEIRLLQGQFVLRAQCWLPGFLGIGSVVSLLWFRRCDSPEKSPLPPNIRRISAAILLVLLAGCVVISGLAWKLWGWLPEHMYGTVARWTLSIIGSFGAIAAVGGAIQARLSDRRWQAVYIMGLTLLIMCAVTLSFLTRMDGAGLNSDEWWVPYSISCGAVVGWGLLGTGAALC